MNNRKRTKREDPRQGHLLYRIPSLTQVSSLDRWVENLRIQPNDFRYNIREVSKEK